MFKYLKILFLFSAFIFAACSGSREVTSQFNNCKIKIDGNISEWQRLTNIPGENISFGFSNDSTNLYISMITSDENKISAILRGGLEVWIDPGKPNDKIGIRYPEKPDPGEMIERMKKEEFQESPIRDHFDQIGNNENRELDPGMVQFLSTQKFIYIINENGRVLKSYPINSDLYKVNLNVTKNTLCYEISVPFGKNQLLNIDAANEAKAKLNVKFISGDVATPLEKIKKPAGSDDNDIQQSNQTNQGDYNSRGGGGPGAPGMNPNIKKSNEPISYKFEVILAR
jgi:hypothetical protein